MLNIKLSLLSLLFVIIPSFVFGQEDRIHVSLETTEGTILLELYNETPLHRDNFIKKATVTSRKDN